MTHAHGAQRRFMLGTTALALALTSWPLSVALAQGADDEMIVTARKREETLQSVPVAVTAIGGDNLLNLGIQTPQDLGTRVPSLIARPTTSSGTGSNYSLRGQAAGDTLLTTDTAVGVYLDGVYVARQKGLNVGLFDIARVEVLKGPQGTLYGRNTTGGAINFISRGADYDGVHGFIGGEAGNYANWKVNGAINVPIITDKLALRLGYQRWKRDGFGRSRVTGQKLGYDKNDHFFRGTLMADPWEGVNIEIKGEWTQMRQNGNLNVARSLAATPTAVGQAFVTPNCADAADGIVDGVRRAFTCPPAVNQARVELGLPNDDAGFAAALNALLGEVALGNANIYENSIQNLNRDHLSSFTLGGTATFDLAENVQLKSITGVRQYTLNANFDLDGTRFQILEVGLGVGSTIPISENRPGSLSPNFSYISPPDQEVSFFSQEFNLSGEAMGGRLNWLGGVYYSNENGRDLQTSRVRPATITVIPFNDGFEIQNTSWSVYAQNDLGLDEILDGLSLTFGGRYTEERRTLASRNANYNPVTGLFLSCLTGVTIAAPGVPDNAACQITNDATFTGFSWLGSLNWQVNEDLLLYVKNARGFRGGAHQLRAPDLPAAGPETARETEIGVKSQWFDQRLTANLAAYTTKYGNKQESIIFNRPNGTLATVIQNAASAKIKGVELEVAANPIEGLSLFGNVSYIQGKYVSFPGALPIYSLVTTPLGAAVPNASVDASGDKFAIPPWTYAVGGRYEFPLFFGTLGAGANWAWTSGARPPARLAHPNVPAAVLDDQVALLPTFHNGRRALGLLNATVDYNVPDYGVTVTFFVNNALDEAYSFAAQDATSIAIGNSITGEPRMWGVQIKKTFGEGE